MLVDARAEAAETQAMLQGTKKRTPQRPEDRKAADERRKAQQEVLKGQIAEAIKIRSPADIAEALGVSVQAVSGWKNTGQVATEMLLPLARAVGCRVDDLLTAGATLTPVSGSPTFEGPAPTVGQAIEVITSALIGLKAIERAVARGALSEWATNPEEGCLIVAKHLGATLPTKPPPSSPAPKAGKRARKHAAEKKTQPATLSVIPGGGNKSQLSLPLNAVLPSPNPFDESNASGRERSFYARWTK